MKFQLKCSFKKIIVFAFRILKSCLMKKRR